MGLNRPGFSAYLALGYPDPGAFPQVLGALAPCVDFFEIGLPSPNPKYDGPIVREAHRKTLETLGESKPMSLLENSLLYKRVKNKPLILMTYLSDHREDLSKLLEVASSTGFECVLFPDLLFDYYQKTEEYAKASEKTGLRPCYFVSSRFPHKLLTRLASQDPLFIYLGLQPATGVELPVGVERNIMLARRLVGDTYMLAGFAIRTPDMVYRVIKVGADAVVVGSALIKSLRDTGIGAAAELACSLREGVLAARATGVA